MGVKGGMFGMDGLEIFEEVDVGGSKKGLEEVVVYLG